MSQSLKAELTAIPSFSLSSNLVYARSAPGNTFEETYTRLRKKENRLYDDAVVRNLPSISAQHPQHHEWMIRSTSLQKLKRYLTRHQCIRAILEVGCGNGWMTRHLASLQREVCAIDINEKELRQAARLCQSDAISFVCGDLFTIPLPKGRFDLILLAGSIQYFEDLDKLIARLLELTGVEGEIQILDSPFYQPGEEISARKRSEAYFNDLEEPGMASHYFHHSYQALKNFDWEYLYNPNSSIHRLRKLLSGGRYLSFPWIRIKPR